MAVYQDKAKERIKKGLRRMNGVVERAIRDDWKEADTRKIVTDVLVQLLGWNEYANITCEQMIGSRYADFVIRKEGEQIAVIEVKQVGLKLKDTHLNQARLYAIDEGIDWIVLTNGDHWKVYRMELEGKVPVSKHVFDVTISDSDMKPAEKAELLYLMSEEAHRKHEINDYYQRKVALSGPNLADHILGDDVINKLRNSIRSTTGQRLSNSEIANALVSRLFRPDAVTEDHQKAIKKMIRQEKQKSSLKKSSPNEPSFPAETVRVPVKGVADCTW